MAASQCSNDEDEYAYKNKQKQVGALAGTLQALTLYIPVLCIICSMVG